jgi:acetyl-CoA decarbonylase/synthase complex subunit gamma
LHERRISMALTGLEIYRQLPRTNCGDCGVPTCLAFAMKLANKQASLEDCPHVSEEAKAALGAASAPPIRLVTIGTGDNKLEIGNETVMFRHEETFHHPTGIAIEVDAAMSEAELTERVEKINELQFERVGQNIGVNLIAVRDGGSGAEGYAKAVEKISSMSQLPLILIADDSAVTAEALKVCANSKPLIYAATPDNYESIAQLAKENSCPLAVAAEGLEELASLTEKIKALGVEDMVLDSKAKDMVSVQSDLTHIRRLALRKTFRPLGYPAIAFTMPDDPIQEAAEATSYVAKYAGIVVMKNAEPWVVLPVLTMRQNIYTDPQKPIQMEPKVYPVGNVTNESPVLITTNFSLTYFSVEGEVEASRIPAYILSVDTEGQSVLTAYAAEKFTAESVAAAIKKFDLDNLVGHKKAIIPGFVAVMSGALAEESGWEVLVGPREASGIPTYLKTMWRP